jgi:hypothetical protein
MGELHLVVPPGEVKEVADVEAEVLLAIELQHALHLGRGGAAARGLPALVIQPEAPLR